VLANRAKEGKGGQIKGGQTTPCNANYEIHVALPRKSQARKEGSGGQRSFGLKFSTWFKYANWAIKFEVHSSYDRLALRVNSIATWVHHCDDSLHHLVVKAMHSFA
jgi:hypothetical protein